MGGGLESRCVGRVCGVDVAVRLLSRFPVVSLEFFIHIILLAELCNIYWEVKAAGA